MLGDYFTPAVANECKATLMSQRVATDSKIMSGDEDELYQSSQEQFLATTQHIKFRPLYVAMQNVDCFNLLQFHQVRHTETRNQDFA